MEAEYTETVFQRNTILAIPDYLVASHGPRVGFLDKMKKLRKKLGWTQTQLAERMGVAQPTVQRWEQGKREPEYEQLFKLADLLGVDPISLIDSRNTVSMGPRLFIKGDVAAGVWREAVEHPESDWETFTGRPGVTADVDHRFGLRVVGDSMDLVYPEGSIVECVSVFGRVEVVPGKRVIVLRRSDQGEYEATVKEMVAQNGEIWMVPRSSNPAHVPFKLNEMEAGIEEHRIMAVVVASVRPE